MTANYLVCNIEEIKQLNNIKMTANYLVCNIEVRISEQHLPE